MYDFEKFPNIPVYHKATDEERFNLAKVIPRLLRLIPELRELPDLYHSRLPFMSFRYCMRGRNNLTIGELLELWEQGVARDAGYFFYKGMGNKGGSSMTGVGARNGLRKQIWVSPTALGEVACRSWGCKGERNVFPPEVGSGVADFSEVVRFACSMPIADDFGDIPPVVPPFLRNLLNLGHDPVLPEMEFTTIPSGDFMMGFSRNPAEYARKPFEGVSVAVDEFDLMTTPITLEMWNAVTQDMVISESEKLLPVNHLNWHDCNAFAELLSSLDDQFDYRLPTEAEWEFACRADRDTEYYWGDEPEDDPLAELHSSSSRPGSVGLRLPNAFGLHDMGRVVSEWCDGHYDPMYPNYFAGQKWTGVGYRILKGGISGLGRQFQTAFSGCLAPWLNTGWKYGTGFRLVRVRKRINQSKTSSLGRVMEGVFNEQA